jgi:hypothetical protein
MSAWAVMRSSLPACGAPGPALWRRPAKPMGSVSILGSGASRPRAPLPDLARDLRRDLPRCVEEVQATPGSPSRSPACPGTAEKTDAGVWVGRLDSGTSLPPPGEGEVRDRPDDVDECQRGPHPLRAVDLLRRSTSDIDKRRRQECDFNSTGNDDQPAAACAELAPRLVAHSDTSA